MLTSLAIRLLLLVTASIATAQDALELNKPLKRDLAAGQSHSYALTLGAQQFVNLIVEQQGIDAELLVSDAEGKQVARLNLSNSTGTEAFSFVAASTGTYKFTIQAVDAKANPGAYQITVLTLRPATEADQAVAAAYASYLESLTFTVQKKTEEALTAQENAVTRLEQMFAANPTALEVYPPNVVSWYANLLLEKGRRVNRKGDFTQAEALYQRSIALLEARFGLESLELVNSVNELGILHYSAGNLNTAITLLQRVLSIQQKALPPVSIGIASSLTNLGAFLYLQGDYVKSEQSFLQAKALWERMQRKEVNFALGGIAAINFERGDYEQAEALWKKALELIDAGKAAPSQNEATLLGNLGDLYQRKGDQNLAESYQLRALEMRKTVLSPEHPDVAISYNHLGDVYYAKGEWAKAIDYYSQGLELLKKKFGPDHLLVAYALHGMARAAQQQRDYAKAEPWYKEALNLRQRVLGTKYPPLAADYSGLAAIYKETGDFKQSLQYQKQANELNEVQLKLNLSSGSERQKLAYLSLFTKDINATLGLHAWGLSSNQEAAQVAFTALLQSKGRGLDAMADTMAAFRRHANAEQLKLYDELSAARSQLANLTLRGVGNEKPAQYQVRLKKLEDQIDNLEGELSRRSAEFSTQNTAGVRHVTVDEIRSTLPPQTSLLEFAAYQPIQFSAKTAAPTHYLAYVLSADGSLRWKELGEAAAIDQSIEKLRQALRDPMRADVRELARQVDAQVMQPLRALLGDTKHLLISPDGLLNLLPFAALVDEQQQYLIERYSISYVTSGRDLLRMQVARAETTAPMIVADPDFDLQPQGLQMTLAKRTVGRQRGTVHGVRAADENFSKWSADRLFETAKEAEAIKGLLPEATVLARAKATKTALTQVAAPKILHIATHGFFLEDNATAEATDSTARRENTAPRAPIIKDPLLRSGLILAGFNQHRTDGDNGVLTAKEAAGLNLWGTRLVVLSACDTGLGEVKKGDGVYGLRRALVLAGAETLVMSLWPVDDVATRELMTAYYTGLNQGLGRAEALRQVQLKMLQKKGRQHPFFWASFIPSGEWANLQNKR